MTTLDQSILAQFTGTTKWYRHPVNRQVTFTEGVKYVADTAGAYWLLDEIAIPQPYKKALRAEEFQVWKLAVSGSQAALTCDDGNGRVVYRKKIPFTDFPAEGITLWFTGNVILLPSEY
jgi:hypothetical protein